MGSSAVSRILLCADEPTAAEDVCILLEQAGHAVSRHHLSPADLTDLPSCDLVVLESARDAVQLYRRVRTRLKNGFVPFLLLSGDLAMADRLTTLEGGGDSCLLRPFAAGELLAQVQSLLHLKRLHDRLAEKTAEVDRVHKQLQQVYADIDQELEMARRIQQSLLPRTAPHMPPAQFAVHYRPRSRVGGDFYDIFRLDEDHVGFYVADVVGHGVAASLLTIFLKKAVQTKQINGTSYRLLPPNEVLQNLNRDMISQALAENPFITMVYALFNLRDGTLSFSRAGHPHPLYLPRSGEPKFWEVHGTLLGVFETHFSVRTEQLHSGDKLLLYTDGLDNSADGGDRQGAQRLMEQAMVYRTLPIDAFVEQVARELFTVASQPDDFTLLGLEWLG